MVDAHPVRGCGLCVAPEGCWAGTVGAVGVYAVARSWSYSGVYISARVGGVGVRRIFVSWINEGLERLREMPHLCRGAVLELPCEFREMDIEPAFHPEDVELFWRGHFVVFRMWGSSRLIARLVGLGALRVSPCCKVFMCGDGGRIGRGWFWGSVSVINVEEGYVDVVIPREVGGLRVPLGIVGSLWAGECGGL